MRTDIYLVGGGRGCDPVGGFLRAKVRAALHAPPPLPLREAREGCIRARTNGYLAGYLGRQAAGGGHDPARALSGWTKSSRSPIDAAKVRAGLPRAQG